MSVDLGIDECWMARALALAEQASARGEVPVGAVVVLEGREIGAGFNAPISGCDPTAHAEIQALRDAASRVGNYRLSGATLYVTLEPCTMCVGAIVHSRVSRLVYGAAEPKAGAVESARCTLEEDHFNWRVEATGGVLAGRCSEVISQFFSCRRAEIRRQRKQKKAGFREGAGQTMKVLVTGGAGYIGSHVVRQLGEAGHDVVVFDNLSTGYRWAVTCGELVVGDLADESAIADVFSRHRFDAVLHFAANIVVPESVENPLKYYSNNTRNTLNLLRAVEQNRVPYMVFSSTAAVYGMPEQTVLTEDLPLAPINPYGASKMMSERMIMDLAAASSLNYVILRYFNVAGANPDGVLGQATPEATHLIKVASECVTGKRDGMSVFGTDYDTRDGTCIRDYIHVDDLAKAHVMALGYMADGGNSQVLNCGYGRGFTVREVIDVVKRQSGVDFPVRETGRRAGDPAALMSDNGRIKQILGWQPDYDDLETIVGTALAWEKIWQDRQAAENA